MKKTVLTALAVAAVAQVAVAPAFTFRSNKPVSCARKLRVEKETSTIWKRKYFALKAELRTTEEELESLKSLKKEETETTPAEEADGDEEEAEKKSEEVEEAAEEKSEEAEATGAEETEATGAEETEATGAEEAEGDDDDDTPSKEEIKDFGITHVQPLKRL